METSIGRLQQQKKMLLKKLEVSGGVRFRSIIVNAARRIVSVRSRGILDMGLNTYGAQP